MPLDASRSFAPPSVLPDISPSRGEIGCHFCFRQFSTLKKKLRRRSCKSPPSRGEMPGRAEGGAVPPASAS
ncbi:hypothetical protein B5V02_09540 [Mesorhizobium kowhaii]|uniref:Propionyl-coenzyme A carboxylase alpha polypeptide n=1 Tax=Mesorhizobium kowhaii TaxID=1300272 RepID=A0A2W7CA38_9HYPH|nr:hypothetical protein B5V02_09540 [Mesorhizobium kowhaii]